MSYLFDYAHHLAHFLLVAQAGGPHGVAPTKITFFQAIVLGVLQGVTELFPVSSLGHTVVFPALFGWHNLVASESKPESFWLAFVVALHVGTALALVVFFWKEWKAIVGGLLHSARTRTVTTPTERLGWLLVVATIPAGITGLVFEHRLRVLFTKPLAASIFLVVNGFILFGGEVARRRAEVRERRGSPAARGSSRRSTSKRPASSGRHRCWPCSPASAARASRWWRAGRGV